jgi:hypothetical protein
MRACLPTRPLRLTRMWSCLSQLKDRVCNGGLLMGHIVCMRESCDAYSSPDRSVELWRGGAQASRARTPSSRTSTSTLSAPASTARS